MRVSFNELVSINTYQKRAYIEIIGNPHDEKGDNPCYLTLGMSRYDRLKYFYVRSLVRKYFDAWCQLKFNPLIQQDDCSD